MYKQREKHSGYDIDSGIAWLEAKQKKQCRYHIYSSSQTRTTNSLRSNTGCVYVCVLADGRDRIAKDFKYKSDFLARSVDDTSV
jgi:hypothetical protein